MDGGSILDLKFCSGEWASRLRDGLNLFCVGEGVGGLRPQLRVLGLWVPA